MATLSKKLLIPLIVVPIVLFFLSLLLGRYPIDFPTVVKVLASRLIPITRDWSDTIEAVVFSIRLPRILMAMLVGGGLSISGAAFQGMFRNPLVSPDILGVSSAAGFGAALAILLSGGATAIQISAFAFGILGAVIAYFLSRVYRTTPILMLVLSGIVVGALFSALISGVKYVADPYEKLPAITFWLMGSFGSATTKDLLTILPTMSIGIIGLNLVRWRINVLAMGDEEAHALGVKTEFLKGFIIVCATMVTAASVSVSGIIGWVGLVIPHIARMIVGADHRVLLPASLALGSSYLLIIDNIARTMTASEIPLGILTAVVGAPFFAYLIRKTKGAWR